MVDGEEGRPIFQIRTLSPLDDRWEARDELIETAAGRKADKSIAGGSVVEHLWFVRDFDEGQLMRKRLCLVVDVSATMSEKTSQGHHGFKK